MNCGHKWLVHNFSFGGCLLCSCQVRIPWDPCKANPRPPVCSCSCVAVPSRSVSWLVAPGRPLHEHSRGQRYCQSVQWWPVGECVGAAYSWVVARAFLAGARLRTTGLDLYQCTHSPTSPHLNITPGGKQPVTRVHKVCTTEWLFILNAQSLLTFSPEHYRTGHPTTEHSHPDFVQWFACPTGECQAPLCDSQSSHFPLPTPEERLRSEGESKTCHPEKPL